MTRAMPSASARQGSPRRARRVRRIQRIQRRVIHRLRSSSEGPARYRTGAFALFKPDVRISRIRLTHKLSVQSMHRMSTARRSQFPQARCLKVGVVRRPCRCPAGALTATLHFVKPKSRLLFGLAAQFPPQLRDFRRQPDPGFHLRRNRRSIVVGRFAFRSGMFIQADLLASHGNTFMAGALRSAGITRRQHYYGPLRLPARPTGGYGFPPTVENTPHPGELSPCRVSQVHGCSFDARRPQPPRAAQRMHTPVTSPPAGGLAQSGRLAATN